MKTCPRLPSFLRCSLLAGTFALATSSANADAPGPNVLPIQVIAVRSDDAEDQADALTAALRNRVRASRGFSLGDGDYALEVLTLGLKCGEIPDEACQIKIGNQIHADRFLWGTVKRSKNAKQVVAELHLWTRGRVSTRTEFTFSDNLTAPGDDGLRRLVDEALNTLLERTKPPSSAASSAAPAAAGSAAPRSSPPRSLPAPEAPPLSTATATDPALETSNTAEKEADSTGSSAAQTWGWIGIGTGAALIGAGVFSALRVSAIQNDDKVERYRQGFSANVDTCSKAASGVNSSTPGAATPTEMQDFCSSATTMASLEYVFFGLGLLSAGAGVYLLATDTSTHAARTGSFFAVTPPIGRSGGSVKLGFTF